MKLLIQRAELTRCGYLELQTQDDILKYMHSKSLSSGNISNTFDFSFRHVNLIPCTLF